MLETLLCSLLLSASHALPVAAGQEAATAAEDFIPREWLVIEPVEPRGRRPVRPDAVFARHLLDRDAEPPREGETLKGEHGEKTWERFEAGEDGNVGGRRGWGYTEVEWDRDEVVMAELRGAWSFFVGGAGFCGDAYGYGFKGCPVQLRKGKNHVYVTGIRGGFRLRFWRPEFPAFVGDWDVTKPDLMLGPEAPAGVGFALPVINALTYPVWPILGVGHVALEGLPLQTPFEFSVPPLSVSKATLTHDWTKEELDDPRLTVILFGTRERAEVSFGTVAPGVPRLSTFRSDIDGALQEFALRPATEPPTEEAPHGLVISCHGAGVGCRGQSNAYGLYPDLWIVAPTNRRPYGFDWQDWGRTDTYEVLERALAISGADPDRVYLTGHSMGGHGVWSLAANDPDRFAAIAPSAGWASFDTYGGRPEGELAEQWHAADGNSLTFTLIDNLAQLPTFVLHGDKDDNVPPSEAHAMIAALEAAGATPARHFQEGAGHWWDGDAAPGADCLTWPAIFELFAATRRESSPLEAHFVGIDPVIDAEHHFLRVTQPLEYGKPFSVSARFDVDAKVLFIETENVRTLSVAPAWEIAPERISLDGTELEAATHFVREGGSWRTSASAPDRREKGPQRSGPFKRAFDRRFLLVYGTAGDDQRDRELLERARYDGAEWLYRANGSVPVISDERFLAAESGLAAGRNVILYGNRDTNLAWGAVLPEEAPVDAGNGFVRIGEKHWVGDDLCCLFVYPRRDEPECLVGAFADSGIAGTRLGYNSGKFIAGVGIPDVMLFDSSTLEKGDGGVLAAGWFDHRWRWPGGFVERGDETVAGEEKARE